MKDIRKIIMISMLLVALLVLSGVAFAAPDFSVDSLVPGDEGDDVVLLQQELIKLGLLDETTGIYDEDTAAAVSVMQEALGLEPDGAFTVELLEAYIAFTSPTPSESPVITPDPMATPDNVDPQTSPIPSLAPEGAQIPEPVLTPLAGYIIGIDAGHQLTPDNRLEPIAPDSAYTRAKMSAGATGVRTDAPEYRIALQVAVKLETLLKSSGATVVMTRTSNDVSLSNIDRAVMMNESAVDFWIRIHCNYSVYSRALSGAYALTPSRLYSPDICDASFLLGDFVLNSFCDATGAKNHSVRQTALQTGFNWSNSPVVTVEMGYLSNAADDLKLNRNSYQNKCAEGMYSGILAYIAAK